jgi:hypothetical protein
MPASDKHLNLLHPPLQTVAAAAITIYTETASIAGFSRPCLASIADRPQASTKAVL